MHTFSPRKNEIKSKIYGDFVQAWKSYLRQYKIGFRAWENGFMWTKVVNNFIRNMWDAILIVDDVITLLYM